MNAAIYARKSTPEEDKQPNGTVVHRHEHEKSVTRQKEEARAYAERKGWTVADAHVYEDDALSGKYGPDHRPGLMALLAAAETAPRPFDVVVMAKDDRLMRDQWKVAVVLSRLHEAGAKLYYYQEDRAVNLDDATGRFMEQVRGYASEAYRESVTAHMVDALKRKAKSGYVHGGAVFGYTNVRVNGHVEYAMHPEQAAVIRRIFTEYAAGKGLRGIAKVLNAEHLPCPRPRTSGGPAGWSSITIRDIIKRERYRGVVVSRWGDEEIRVERPELRIISDELWQAVQHRRQQAAQIYLRGTKGMLWGKPASSIESRYLLTGMGLCPCGSGLTVRSRSRSRARTFYYVCRAAIEKGTVCTNRMHLPVPLADAAVTNYLEGVLLHPDVVAEAVRRVMQPDPNAEPVEQQRGRLQRDLDQVHRELSNLSSAIAAGGGQVETLVKEIKTRERRRTELQATLTALDRASVEPAPDPAQLRQRIDVVLTDWRGMAAKHVQATRQLLRKLLLGRLVFTPDPAGHVVRFTGRGTLAPLVGRLQLQGVQTLVTPAGFEPAVSTLKGSRPGPG
jgi:site-specific DNA recombinase